MQKNPYHDILHLPHPEPVNHPRMSRESRAAQFAPFAALTGYDAAIRETARLTEEQVILEENEISQINECLVFLQEHSEYPVSILYFLPDEWKDGGSYEVFEGKIRKIDAEGKKLVTESDRVISFSEIRKITIEK